MKKLISIFLLVVLLTFGISSLVLADGTETLGPPSITIASGGTGMVAAGTGMETQPGTISVDVPGTVVQALLYWSGGMIGNFPGDDTINVNGNSITGTLIGGPTFFFTWGGVGDFYFSTYRAEITGLISSGSNTLTIDGMSFDSRENNGAGVLVIYDDGSAEAEIDVRDGIDLAFINFPEPRKSTIPQVFSFTPASSDRSASLPMFFGSVSSDGFRPNSIEVTSGGATTVFSNLLASNDGPQWDTLNLSINIPAGADSLTVQAFSRDDNGDGQNPLAASFSWLAAGLSVPPPPPGGEGCTPGGWAGGNGAFRWDEFPDGDWNPTNGNPFYHETVFNDFFTPWGSLDGLTMYDLVSKGGGKDDARKAARSLVAAYLNASHASVNYPLTTGELEALWNEAVAGNIEFIDLHRQLDEFNNLGCSFE